MYYFISIDIGIINLAIIGAYVSTDYTTIEKIDLCDLINLKELNENCCDSNCKFYHNSCNVNYIKHFLKDYKEFFDKTDFILIEKQPPTGLVCIENLLVSELYHIRNKIHLLCPSQMHVFFNINHLDYDNRKKFVVKYSSSSLNSFNSFNLLERQHDLGDAFCYLKFFIQIKSSKYFEEELINKWKNNFHIAIENIESFKYIPPKKSLKNNIIIKDNLEK